MMTRLYCAAYARALMLSEVLRRRMLRVLSAWLAFISPMAMADGDFADMANRVAEGAKAGTTSVLGMVQLAGVCGVIGSIFAAKGMKSNPQIKLWMVALGLVTSLLLLGIPELIKRGQTQMGMTPVSVGS